MKRLVAFLFILFVNPLFAQKSGIINDPDGYTNIRSGPGTNFEIVGKINEGEGIVYWQNEDSNWWKVRKNLHGGESIMGFVHRSRLQPYYCNLKPVTKCNYLENGGIEKPVLVANLNGVDIAVSGYLLQRFSEKSVKITEFSIINCNEKNEIKFYGARSTCHLNAENNKLEIVEFKRIPVGKKFQWIEAPYEKTTLVNEGRTLNFTKKQVLLDLPNITKSDVNEFESELMGYKGNGYFEDISTFVGKLMICTLKGSERSKMIFYDINNFLDVTLDGADLEFYKLCSEIIKDNAIANN